MIKDSIDFDHRLPDDYDYEDSTFTTEAGTVYMAPQSYSPENPRIIYCKWDLFSWSLPYDRADEVLGIEVKGIQDDCLEDNSPTPDCVWGNISGDSPVVGIDDENRLLPLVFTINSIQPNPFNSSTSIKYCLDGEKSGRLDMRLCDILGRQVKIIRDQVCEPGEYSLDFRAQNEDGEALPSGIYFVRMQWGDKTDIRKLTLLK
ncbi:MAG: hypothetical protein GF315_01740 [candidate division Zixibacteria bacterium]|nr:hypothetical protein [candidate division Zixibacteria bacterium]